MGLSLIVAERLRQGVQRDTCTALVALGPSEGDLAATEAAQRMDDNDVERPRLRPDIGQQLLELGPVLVGARGARFDVLPNQCDPVLRTPDPSLPELIRD
jgi:hypothetical protein